MKPMLAAPVDFDKLTYPCYCSPKLDGIRAIVQNGIVLSRSLKPIPNKHVQAMFKTHEHFDGELIVGSPTAKDVFAQTTSGVMAVEKTPDVRFYVFDHIGDPFAKYSEREARIPHYPSGAAAVRHEQVQINNYNALLTYEEVCLEAGYEGLIIRDPNAPYKFGRSTAKEGYLLKLKRFTDAEFEIIGFEERMHNGNAAEVNELGRSKRSSHQAGKTGRGDLGALTLRLPDGSSFNCGTGFDDGLRQHIWDNQAEYLGQLAKVKYFAIGVKDAPRHPVYLGVRARLDL